MAINVVHSPNVWMQALLHFVTGEKEGEYQAGAIERQRDYETSVRGAETIGSGLSNIANMVFQRRMADLGYANDEKKTAMIQAGATTRQQMSDTAAMQRLQEQETQRNNAFYGALPASDVAAMALSRAKGVEASQYQSLAGMPELQALNKMQLSQSIDGATQAFGKAVPDAGLMFEYTQPQRFKIAQLTNAVQEVMDAPGFSDEHKSLAIEQLTQEMSRIKKMPHPFTPPPTVDSLQQQGQWRFNQDTNAYESIDPKTGRIMITKVDRRPNTEGLPQDRQPGAIFESHGYVFRVNEKGIPDKVGEMSGESGVDAKEIRRMTASLAKPNNDNEIPSTESIADSVMKSLDAAAEVQQRMKERDRAAKFERVNSIITRKGIQNVTPDDLMDYDETKAEYGPIKMAGGPYAGQWVMIRWDKTRQSVAYVPTLAVAP